MKTRVYIHVSGIENPVVVEDRDAEWIDQMFFVDAFEKQKEFLEVKGIDGKRRYICRSCISMITIEEE